MFVVNIMYLTLRFQWLYILMIVSLGFLQFSILLFYYTA
jgi:hypothetical protein